MRKISNWSQTQSIGDFNIRTLLQTRLEQEDTAQYVLVESSDTVDLLETATGCPIVTSWFNDAVFPDDDFAPCFEFIEEHPSCFEMVFVLNDDTSAVVLCIPKLERIDATLLALCQTYS